ncbi:MAG: polysaccharide deacetylase family protein [Nitrospirae bacterium]|nr:polysaccharide deacetylase family protein [Nitrospirota bacterium]
MKLFSFTMDLEADYAGVVGGYEIFKDLGKVEEILSALSSLDVKMTVFTVGEIFELFPNVVKLFEKYACEIEPHSYSHNFDVPDSEDEIARAKAVYLDYFKRQPRGYRAPRGKISDSGIKALERHGFSYDSSLIPSYFPNPFKYLLRNKNIHYYDNSGIMEIPFTSLPPFRLTLSISYIKLLGLDFYNRLSLPEVACFGSHLHDFIINEKSFDKLPLIWKLIYSRNKYSGIDLCMNFLEGVVRKGYRFCYMSEIYDMHKR